MIGARSGQATLSRCTCGSAAATARSYAPLATVAGVASSPIRPVRRHDPDQVNLARAELEVALERVERRRADRVARGHEQLRAGCEQVVGDLDRERLELLGGPLAVREPGGVAQVHVVLGRQRHEQLVQHRQPADAGVEHGDGLVGAEGHWPHGARGVIMRP